MLHLDHTIVPAYDQDESAKFIARMFGLTFDGRWNHFSPVKVDDHLSLDFDTREEVNPSHYAFLASDEEFDSILARVRAEGIPYGSGPRSHADMEINNLHTGRGFYFQDANEHLWEVITHTYI